MTPSSFYKLFSASKVEKCKQLIFLCIFGFLLCIIKWLWATLKTYFYQKIQLKYCSRDQNTNKSQPPKQIYDKRCFLNMSNAHDNSMRMLVGLSCARINLQKKIMNKQTNELMNGVTLSLLELFIAAKNNLSYLEKKIN